jgi:DNA polymerase III alpha subunit
VGVFDSLASGVPRSVQARCLLSGANVGKRAYLRQGSLFGQAASAGVLVEEQVFPKRRNGASTEELSINNVRAKFPTFMRPSGELREEYVALGFLFELHPFPLWASELSRVDRIRAEDLERHVGACVRLLGWPVTQKDVLTKNGLEMNFVSFEDATALYEVVMFPEEYKKYRKMLFDQQPLVVIGTIKADQIIRSVENTFR